MYKIKFFNKKIYIFKNIKFIYLISFVLFTLIQQSFQFQILFLVLLCPIQFKFYKILKILLVFLQMLKLPVSLHL